MNKPVVLIECSPDEYYLRNLAPIREHADFRISTDIDYLKKNVPEADILLVVGMKNKNSLSELWPLAKKVRWVHSLSAGVEQVLFPELVDSDVPLTNAKGVFKRSLAEFAVLGILYFSKRVPLLIEQQHAHNWHQFAVDWLPGRTLAVVGYGEIGRECAVLAKSLGLRITATRRRPDLLDADPVLDKPFRLDQLHEMLSEADYVVAAAPLTPETRHMLSEREFKTMKSSAIVINVGRGPVVDEQALIRALQNGEIAGAALDVFEEEPLPKNSPLWDMPNVLISPHCTDRTRDPDWLDLAMQRFVENFHRFVAGQPLQYLVDKKAGY
jgi:phosphoglycerate dehydrogenase-like enzyme